MKLIINSDGNELQLNSSERRALRKASSILSAMAKYASCKDTTTASEWMETMVAMWGKEDTNE